jgi:hypothetical protein
LEDNTIFCGAVVVVHAETLQDTYLCYKIAKEMWDTLNTEYGGSDAGTELYIIEQYHDYQMVDGKSGVTQAHEIQCIAKELAPLKIVVPDEFVVGALLPNCLLHGGISPLLSNTRGCTCLFWTSSPLLMLRGKLGLRMDNINELRVKPVSTWCTSRSHMAKAKVKLSRIRIIISQSKLLPLRRRRRMRRRMVASCLDLLLIGKEVSKL